MASSRRGVGFALVLALVAGGVARGDETADTKQRAMALFQAGNRAYNLGDYQTALPLFRQAYEISGAAAFLFNIAQCYRMLGKHSDAAREYRAYLRESPDAPNREEVKRRIAEMDAAATNQAPPKPSTAAQPSDGTRTDLVAARPTEAKPRTWLWITLGVTAAVVVAAVALGLAFGLSHSNPPDSTLGNYGALQ